MPLLFRWKSWYSVINYYKIDWSCILIMKNSHKSIVIFTKSYFRNFNVSRSDTDLPLLSVHLVIWKYFIVLRVIMFMLQRWLSQHSQPYDNNSIMYIKGEIMWITLEIYFIVITQNLQLFLLVTLVDPRLFRLFVPGFIVPKTNNICVLKSLWRNLSA